MFAAAGENSGNRTHVAKIAAVGDDDVLFTGLDVVGRVEIHPADAGTEDPEPGVACIRADAPRLACK